MPSRIFYANQEYISGKHLFTTIPNGTNLTLTDLANTPSCNVMIMLNDKVGINTTNPTSALHVVGNVLASGNIGIGTTNLTSALHVVGNVLASGNIGIGTTNPTSALHVVGNVLASGTITASNISVIGDFVTLNTITSNSEQMVITNNGTGPALKVTQTGDNSVAEFYDNESGIALFVGNNGNVGIGTTDPQAKLHVNGTISQFGFPCMFIRNIYEEYDATNRTFSTTFADGKTWTSRSYNANSKLILHIYIPCRNDSTSWGGGYHEVQYNINNTGWLSFGNSGYTSVMSSAGGDIGTYSTVLYMPLTINTTFTCQFKYRHRSFDGTLYVNQSTDVVVGSTNSYGINVNQFYTKLLIVEVGG